MPSQWRFWSWYRRTHSRTARPLDRDVSNVNFSRCVEIAWEARWVSVKLEHTPQCALDDLEIRDVAQEVGRARRIGVEGACGTAIRGAVSSTVCGSVDICGGRDGVRGGRAVQGDLNHLRVVCGLGGAVLAGAHGNVFWLWRGVEDEGDEWGRSQGEERGEGASAGRKSAWTAF